jgi:hypothetical protein
LIGKFLRSRPAFAIVYGLHQTVTFGLVIVGLLLSYQFSLRLNHLSSIQMRYIQNVTYSVIRLMKSFSLLYSLLSHIAVDWRIITCKRGSAKHSVKDDHAFLWKHAIFSHLPSRNPLIDQDEILHD